MAIFVKNKEIATIASINKFITSIYKGTKIVWEAIKGCFSKGYWLDANQWNDEDAWKDNI